MWHLAGQTLTVNLTDGTTFVGRCRFTFFWSTIVLDRAELVAGERRALVEGRLRIPARSILFVQVAGGARAEVEA